MCLELQVELTMPGLQPLELRALPPQVVLALDHAFVRVPVTADAQPVRTDPDPLPRDHGLSGLQLPAYRQGLGQRIGCDDAVEERVETARSLHPRAQRTGVVTAADRALPGRKERHRAGSEALERARHVVDRLDTDGLEVGPEHRLDGALPAGFHRQLLREALVAVEPARLEPVDDLALPLPERRALQRLERNDAALDLLGLASCRLRGLGEFALARALRLQRGDQLADSCPRRLEDRTCFGFRALDLSQRRRDVGGRQRAVFLRRALALRHEPTELVVHFAEACALGFGRGRRGSQRLVEYLPVLLPGLHRAFRLGQACSRVLLRGTGRLERGTKLGEQDLERRRLLDIPYAMRACILEALRDLLEFLALAAADLARMLHRLLGARYLGTNLVITTLHRGKRLAMRIVVAARTLDRGLDGALLGECRLQREVTLAQDRLARAGLGLDLAETQRQQFRLQLPLFLLQRLVAARGRGLSLEMPELLLDLVAQVAQAGQVLARVRDAALGLAAPLLVARNAGGFLEEGPHLVGLRLDDARDHVLLDDRVAARAEAGAEEQLRDVLATATHAVQEIRRRAVAGDQPLQRDLRVARVLAAELAVRVVEDEFDEGIADRLARRGAVEDDVRHRVAAQVLGRDLAHHPAHGVDDVRLAAAVRSDDADEAARKTDRRRVDERLESGQLDLGQAHRSPAAEGGSRKVRKCKRKRPLSQHPEAPRRACPSRSAGRAVRMGGPAAAGLYNPASFDHPPGVRRCLQRNRLPSRPGPRRQFLPRRLPSLPPSPSKRPRLLRRSRRRRHL